MTDNCTGEPATTKEAPVSYSRLGWSALLSVAVLLVIGYYTFEPSEFRQLIAQLNPWPLVAAFGTLVLRVVLGGWRLSYVSRGRLNISSGTRGQLAWDFFSNVSPSAIGGGPFAAIYIARERNIPVGETTAIMLFTMLLDQLWFAAIIPPLIVAMSFMQVLPESIGTVGTMAFLSLFAGMLVWLLIFGYAVLFRPELLQGIVDRVFRIKWLRRFRKRVASSMGQLGERARVLRGQPILFYINGFLLTMGVWISRFLLPVFIIWSVSPDVDKLLVFARTAIMSIGTVVLPTPGGSGGIEGLYMLLMGPPLMPETLVAPTLLVWRVLGYYLFLGLGVFLSMNHVQKSISRYRTAGKTHVADRPPIGDGAGHPEPIVELQVQD